VTLFGRSLQGTVQGTARLGTRGGDRIIRGEEGGETVRSHTAGGGALEKKEEENEFHFWRKRTNITMIDRDRGTKK